MDSTTVEITNPEKILFPSGITKHDLVNYYKKISGNMLPYMKDRALALERFPDGIDKERFYQKNIPSYTPKYVKSIKIKKTNYPVCNNEASLLYLANLATIPFHGWLSRIDKLNYPDKLIFDLDPQREDYLDELSEVAKGLKFILEKLGMKVFLMSTGSRGLHLIVPLNREADFKESRNFAFKIAEFIKEKSPGLITTNIRKEKRKGKIFIDIYRNSFSQLAILPYSVRAKDRGPIASPLSWNELDNFYPSMYNINKIPRKNPWKDFFKKNYSIKKAKKIFDSLH